MMTEYGDKTKDSETYVDLADILVKVWASRRFVFRVCCAGVVAALVIAFSAPKEYVANASLAPETGGVSSLNGMGALASFAGVDLNRVAGEDAISVELYPSIVSSTPFIADLLGMEVRYGEQERTMSLYDYMADCQREPWWNHIQKLPVRMYGGLKSLFSPRGGSPSAEWIDAARLTRAQAEVVGALRSRIGVEIDKKTYAVVLVTRMQDPVVASAVAERLLERLKSYVTEYRTDKARADMAFSEKLYDEAREDYHAAQRRYAAFMDRNHDIISNGYRVEQERLANETSLAFGVYSQTAQQYSLARARVQEITPVFAVVEPPSVPVAPSSPRKLNILLGMLFLSLACAVVWVLFGRGWLDSFRKTRGKQENNFKHFVP